MVSQSSIMLLALLASANLGEAGKGENTDISHCTPQELAPGVISSTGHEVFRGVFAPSNSQFTFFRSMPGQENYGIFFSQKSGTGWQTPERLILGSPQSDFYPAYSLDGRSLVFSSYRPTGPNEVRAQNANLWRSRKTQVGWSTPELLTSISVPEQYDNRAHFLTDNTLRFSSTSADWSESLEYVANIADDGAVTPPQPDQDRNQFRTWAQDQPDIQLWTSDLAPDGNLAIIEISEVSTEGRPGPADLWYSAKQGKLWTEPRPIGGSVNTDKGNENFPTFTSDGKTMTFVRDFRSFYTMPASCISAAPPADAH